MIACVETAIAAGLIGVVLGAVLAMFLVLVADALAQFPDKRP